MRKKTKMIFIMICMCLSMGLFTGCVSKEETELTKQPIHTALILQSVTNVPVVNIEASGELLKEVCSTPGSSISIIIADGLPWEYANIKPEDIDDSFDPVMQEQILNQRLQELVQIVKSATAKNPESDLRRAIEMGARYLQSCDNGRKEMVILGSGINTVAPLSMQDMILSNMDVNATIQKLEDEAYIANL
ncbi:MAG: hypothetical protein IKJ01_05405, partial [Lachnospiraceae bacterium]|nr:hypothetical protein [Lachnospiraceae bacterium]